MKNAQILRALLYNESVTAWMLSKDKCTKLKTITLIFSYRSGRWSNSAHVSREKRNSDHIQGELCF